MTWQERHSVNCYYCGALVDERECQPADVYNHGDGGSICPECLVSRKRNRNKCGICGGTKLDHLGKDDPDVANTIHCCNSKCRAKWCRVWYTAEDWTTWLESLDSDEKWEEYLIRLRRKD